MIKLETFTVKAGSVELMVSEQFLRSLPSSWMNLNVNLDGSPDPFDTGRTQGIAQVENWLAMSMSEMAIISPAKAALLTHLDLREGA